MRRTMRDVIQSRKLRDRMMIRLAVEVAMRRGELAAVRWSHFDLDTATVTVRRNIVRDTLNGGLIDKRTKGKNLRVASLTNAAVADLIAYRDDLIERDAHTPDGYIFPSGKAERETQHPIDPYTLTKRCRALMRKAGVRRPSGEGGFTLRDLRRSAATFARDAGVSEDVIRDQLGHRDSGVTRSHYIRTQINPNIGDFASALESMTNKASRQP